MRGFGVRELLTCYTRGVFPMAEARHDPRIYLLDPDERGIIPLDEHFHISRRLKRTVKQDRFHITVNRCFATVVEGCATPQPGREDTWINDHILNLYIEMHEQGFAHSLEVWYDQRLAGGLYGVSIGGAFFGESMFSKVRDASKVALVHLVARLKAGGYSLLDAQFTTDHLETFGADVISRADYKARLAVSTEETADFFAWPEGASGAQALQSITQTS